MVHLLLAGVARIFVHRVGWLSGCCRVAVGWPFRKRITLVIDLTNEALLAQLRPLLKKFISKVNFITSCGGLLRVLGDSWEISGRFLKGFFVFWRFLGDPAPPGYFRCCSRSRNISDAVNDWCDDDGTRVRLVSSIGSDKRKSWYWLSDSFNSTRFQMCAIFLTGP